MLWSSLRYVRSGFLKVDKVIGEPASGSMETSGPPGIIKPFRLENIWFEIMRMRTNLTTGFLGFNLSEVVGLI